MINLAEVIEQMTRERDRLTTAIDALRAVAGTDQRSAAETLDGSTKGRVLQWLTAHRGQHRTVDVCGALGISRPVPTKDYMRVAQTLRRLHVAGIVEHAGRWWSIKSTDTETPE